MTKTERQNEIERRLAARCREELSEADTEKLFDDMLDECSEPLPSCLSHLSVSRIMREMCPTDYRCGHVDYLDGLISDGVVSDEIDGRHYDGSEVENLREEIEAEIDAEIEEKEREEEEAAEEEAEG